MKAHPRVAQIRVGRAATALIPSICPQFMEDLCRHSAEWIDSRFKAARKSRMANGRQNGIVAENVCC